MSLIKCPKCGEMFSDSYKTCPFCEEDEAYYGGRLKKSRGRRAVEGRKKKAPSALGPVAIVVLVLLLALVVWLLFGDRIREALDGGSETPPVVDVDNTDKDKTDTPDDTTPVTPTISLNRTILALAPNDKETLKVSGTEDTASWESSDPTIVTVTSSGEVTALADGTAVITARVGDESVTCTVTVKEKTTSTTPDDTTKPDDSSSKPDSSTKPSSNTKVDVSKLYLESIYGTTIDPVDGTFDLTISLSEYASQFTVGGTDMKATWSGGNSSVATVTSDGTIKPVGRGDTTLTITIGSTEVKCLVRVVS